MAREDRNQANDLTDWLLADPRRADFFLLVRALQSSFPEAFPRVGEANRVAQEPIRFGQPPFLEFAPSPIEAVRNRKVIPFRSASTAADVKATAAVPAAGQGERPPDAVTCRKITQYFFGLFGPNGPLPLHLTEYAMSRWRHHKDPVLMEFADLFHNRMVAFFFRAWAEVRMDVDLDRGLPRSRFAGYVGSLAGLGSPTVSGRDSIGELAKLHYAGHLGRQTRNVDGLADLLTDYFQVPVEILTFQGRWLELPKDFRCALGGAPESSELGRTAMVGTMVWDCQLTIRVRVGPVSVKELGRFLPGRRSFVRLKDWIRLYCNQPFFWDLQLVVKRAEVMPIQLGREEAVAAGPGGGASVGGTAGRLGWTTWLTTRPVARDPEDLIIQPDL